MAAAAGLVRSSDVTALRDMQDAQTRSVESKTLYDIERREALQRDDWHMVLFATGFVVCFVAFVVVRVQGLVYRHPRAYHWWDTTFASSLYARPLGTHPKITVPGCALRVEFPPAHWAATLLMSYQELPRAGADFLLLMVAEYGDTLHPIHWNGSSAQLRYEHLEDFLPRGPGTTTQDSKGNASTNWAYIWRQFNAKNAAGALVNPWAGALWRDPKAMALSPAMQAYYDAKAPRTDYIEALYRGGLVELAVTHAKKDVTGAAMVRHLMGTVSTTRADTCTPAKQSNNMVQGATEFGMYGTMGGPALAKGIVSLAPRLEPRAGAIGLAIAAGAAAFGAFAGNSCDYEGAVGALTSAAQGKGDDDES